MIKTEIKIKISFLLYFLIFSQVSTFILGIFFYLNMEGLFTNLNNELSLVELKVDNLNKKVDLPINPEKVVVETSYFGTFIDFIYKYKWEVSFTVFSLCSVGGIYYFSLYVLNLIYIPSLPSLPSLGSLVVPYKSVLEWSKNSGVISTQKPSPEILNMVLPPIQGTQSELLFLQESIKEADPLLTFSEGLSSRGISIEPLLSIKEASFPALSSSIDDLSKAKIEAAVSNLADLKQEDICKSGADIIEFIMGL
jgi:hypothetical protein